jgi:cytochrome P450
MDLLLVDYIIQHKGHVGSKVDTKFMTKVIPELRLMFFLGHDSTTSAICYSVYLLSQNASALAKVRSEHDEVFGTDLEATSRILREQSHLINQLPYTTALIKEALRLFTPASGFRAGEPDLYLHDEQGNRYPTEDTRIWILHSVLHRNPNYWKDPTSFIPERFLVGPDDPLYPPKGAWRPFEHGPRRCFGENLAMMDIKVTLVMLLRRFDFKDAYEEWDQMQGRSKEKVHRFEGERAYQVGQGAAHPADGLPCRVSLREKC